MSDRDFRYVMAIYEEGSISRAAEKIHITQSSLSKFLIELEKDLGYKIFDRSSTPLKLTEYGREYLDTARAVLVLMEDLNRRVAEIENLERCQLRIGMNMTRAFYCLHEILPLFIEKYPGVQVAVTEARTTDLTEYLIGNKIDLMIVDGPPQSSLLKWRILHNERFYLVTPPGLIPKTASDFEQALNFLPDEARRFILLPKGTLFRQLADKVFAQYSMTPHVEHTTQTALAAVKLCIHGLGLTFASSLIKKYFQSSVTPDYFLLDSRFSNPVTAAWRKGGYVPRAVTPFMDLVEDYLRSSPNHL